MPSKLGPHIQHLDDAVKAWVLRARPAIIKVLEPDNVDFWLDAKQQWNPLIIGRRPDLAETIDWTSPEASADEASQLVLEWAEIAPHVNLWEGRNEVIINDPIPEAEQEKARAYIRHEIRFARNLAGTGRKATLFQFSAGNPYTLELWRDILWEAPAKTGCLINLHAYSQPTMQSAAEWLTFRHHRVWRLLPPEAQTGIIISECGIDGGIWTYGLPPPRPQVGWQGYASESEYLAQLKWFDAVLAKDDYVRGATIFNAGSLAPWSSFEITGMGSLADYIARSGVNEGETMTNRELWRKLTVPYESYPALTKAIVGKFGIPIGTEVVEGDYTYQLGLMPGTSGFANDIVAYARTGDWGNVVIAFNEDELPLA